MANKHGGISLRLVAMLLLHLLVASAAAVSRSVQQQQRLPLTSAVVALPLNGVRSLHVY